MICKPFRGKVPVIHAAARVAENATLIGDVVLEEEASVWYGAVLRADSAEIRVGARSNVQDNCVIHVEAGQNVSIGKHVVVGHGAILHACVIEDDCLIGMGAILLNGCRIGAGSMIGAGTVVGEGKEIPAGSLVVGVPGRVVRGLDAQTREAITAAAGRYAEEAEEQLCAP